MAHTCHPITWLAEAGGSEFEVMIGYTVSIRPAGNMGVSLKNKIQTKPRQAAGSYRAPPTTNENVLRGQRHQFE